MIHLSWVVHHTLILTGRTGGYCHPDCNTLQHFKRVILAGGHVTLNTPPYLWNAMHSGYHFLLEMKTGDAPASPWVYVWSWHECSWELLGWPSLQPSLLNPRPYSTLVDFRSHLPGDKVHLESCQSYALPAGRYSVSSSCFRSSICETENTFSKLMFFCSSLILKETWCRP